MKLEELQQNFELKNSLSCLRLPSNINVNSFQNKEKDKNSDISDIKNLLKDMKLNEHRTTHFATIIYIEENNFEKTPMDTIKLKLRKDYNLNKNIFVNSKNNSPFISERNLFQSMNASISRNKSFIIQIINNKKYVSLNESKTLEYLKKMYDKYTVNFNGDITSLASLDSKKSKMSFKNNSPPPIINKSENKRKSKNLIGNKHHRSPSPQGEEIISEEQRKKIKYLKENLRAKKPNDTKKEKKEKITDFFQRNSNYIQRFEENNKTPSFTLCLQEIDKSFNIFDKMEKIMSSYKNKLKELKCRVEEKEKIYKDYENEKLNMNMTEKKMNAIYEAMKLKLYNIQNTKKHKYYGEFFSKSKNLSLKYKLIFDKKIDDIKDISLAICSIKVNIINKNKVISDEIKKISDADNGISYPAKNEIKKDISSLMKKIRNNICGDEYDVTYNNNRIDEAIRKFNDIAQRITQEEEDFD